MLQPEAEEEAAAVDESEERLIRAIQAAHSHEAPTVGRPVWL